MIKKTKTILGSIFLISTCTVIIHYLIYEKLKYLERKLKHNTWEYYE
jgi:hypothetical protein